MSIYSLKGDQTEQFTAHIQPVCLGKELQKSKEVRKKKYFQDYARAAGTAGMSGFWTAKLRGRWGRFAVDGIPAKQKICITSDYINGTD